jgi:glutamate synthase domain-containing protein 2/glutamate synthase domain-containing protein 1/glutamate synthase domain-containing protein 3
MRQLHDTTSERDACGIGFVSDLHGRPSRAILDALLEGLCRVRHRGAIAADRITGDGAGLLLPIPAALLPEPGSGLAMIFLRDDAARAAIESACREEGIEPGSWRVVPVDPAHLGAEARRSLPQIEQLVLRPPSGLSDDESEWRAYRARRRAERAGGAYICSFSYRTLTYKALCAADQLGEFYLDLKRPELAVSFGIFHQRFSTNTAPSWERAQPFRFLCHNGEINAIQGNVNWMRAREGNFGSTDDDLYHPVLDASGSDSAMLDNALDFIVHGGRDIRHALSMLIPSPWEGNDELPREVFDFYRYHAGLIEPWDGPAGVVFTDGRIVGAALDRNGLRPLRYAVCEDGFVACSSEAGAVPLDGHGWVKRGKLAPGQMIAIDPQRGFEADDVIKRWLAARHPYGAWLEEGLVAGCCGTPVDAPDEDLTARQARFGYTREEITMILRPIASHAHDPTYSMGDDAAIAPLAGRARPLYHFFKQRFAQVTNPPIDHLRERFVMSLRTVLGGRAPLLSEGPEVAAGIELESFLLFPDALDQFSPVRLDATFEPGEGLRGACARLGDEAEAAVRAGAGMLLVSDTAPSGVPVPALLATGIAHHRLVSTGLRTKATLVVETDEAREVHHFACLIGYGAEAICPRLVLETLASMAAADKIGGDRPSAAEAQIRYKSAIEDGVLKVMSKMGISDITSYCGAQIFDAIGLAQEVVDVGFVGTPCPIGGIGFEELERELLGRALTAKADKPSLENPGYIKWRKGGEPHETNGDVVDAAHDLAAAHALRKALREPGGWALYERFALLVNGRAPMELRDLLELVPAGPPVPLEEVEPVAAIVKRFSSGAMSHGSLSAEAHETVAIALNRLGARANTGEGGEDPARYRDERNSPIKQVASGRFGVTPEYASFAEELQIKIAQGSKPGEGGQLPGHKVTAEIARLRHTVPGVALISPPPHHDIYSIEDLAQLIFDLKQVNPDAAVSVKLVSESGVGLVAAGVVKALADVVHIAGSDGGTGASPLSSIKNAGCPWELGLAETQQALVANELRGRVRVRADGGFKTGRDVVVAALLGADEVSFGTALLLAEGCLMVRSCHVDTCPVGIATQRPELREKFAGTPEQVMAYLAFVAEEVRLLLASLGLRTFEEAIGRVDLLRQPGTGDPRADSLELDALLARAGEGPSCFAGDAHIEADGWELGARLAEDAGPALEEAQVIHLSYAIGNRDRTVGARLGGQIGRRFGSASPPGRIRASFAGVAGQGFGAFLSAGVELRLVGEANDYVGKGMGGGRIVVSPPEDDAGEPTLLGNTVLYGATGGELYCAGAAGERFCVRNSGATAVVEGAGDHPCEYMTGGSVAILGPYGLNVGAGMTGGQAFVLDPEERIERHLNPQLVSASRLQDDEAGELHGLLERHVRFTGSARAASLLECWELSRKLFWRVAPRVEVARIESVAEGTLQGALP